MYAPGGGITLRVNCAPALRISGLGTLRRRRALVRQLEEVIGENVWTEVVQDGRNDFGELADAFRKDELGEFGERDVVPLKLARATLSLCGRNDILLELAVGHPEGGEPERLFRILQGVTPRRHAAAERLRRLRKVGRLAEMAER